VFELKIHDAIRFATVKAAYESYAPSSWRGVCVVRCKMFERCL
jgi:hypothetical protein